MLSEKWGVFSEYFEKQYPWPPAAPHTPPQGAAAPGGAAGGDARGIVFKIFQTHTLHLSENTWKLSNLVFQISRNPGFENFKFFRGMQVTKHVAVKA